MIKGVQYQYGYDAEDRLIIVNDISGNKIVSYTYDAEGNRSTKTTYSNNNPVNTTTYHYYNGELLYETLNTDPENVIHALYIRTPAGALEAVILNYAVGSSSNTFYYYHYNAHGDVIAVTKTDSSDPTNITGKIYRQYAYDPYGNIISAKDGSGNAIDINNDSGFDDSYLYSGYRYDKESGLYFLNARYYAPGLGRFLSKDSEIDINNAKSLNAYVYCHDDPVDLTDPDGDTPVMTDDAGNYVYSNGKVYHNKPEIRRTDKQVKKIKAQQQKKKENEKKKHNSDMMLGNASRSFGLLKTAQATRVVEEADKPALKCLGNYCAVFSSIVSSFCTCLDPNLTTKQKCIVIGVGIAFTAISIFSPVGIISAACAVAAYIVPNYLANKYDYDAEKAQGLDVKFDPLNAAIWS